METLQEKNAELREALRRVRAEIAKELNGNRANVPMPTAKPPLRCRAALATAEAVFHLADRASAEEYFQLARRGKSGRCMIALPGGIVDAWQEKSESEIMSVLGEPDTPSVARLRARIFLRERNLTDWVREQNMRKACAPGGQAVKVQARRCGALIDQDCARGEKRAAAGNAVKGQSQWLRRWARRWNLRRGRFQAASRLLPADAARKASGTRRGAQLVRKTALFLALVLGPGGGPKTGATRKGGIGDGGRFLVQK